MLIKEILSPKNARIDKKIIIFKTKKKFTGNKDNIKHKENARNHRHYWMEFIISKFSF